ncbi:MAG TPA: glycine oxidase ThiO [Terriglobia bacterium]|nr:glycine oxidase ThiO [Terriglobia bacterium]
MSHQPDAIVIGGGLIGSSVALRLAQSGLSVSVFDRGEPGAEASSAAAGMIAPQGERVQSRAFMELCWASYGLYPEFVAEVESLSGQQVGYRRDGSLLVALDDDQARELEADQAGATAEALGAATAYAPVQPLPQATSRRVPGLSAEILSAVFLPADHWVDNERLTAAVIEAARRQGVAFSAHKAVDRFVVNDARVTSIEADGERFSAGEFVLAAGAWSGTLARSVGLEIPTLPCRGQMMEFELASELSMVVRAGHHYLVPRAGRRAIAGTTAEYAGFEKSVTAAGLASVLEGTLRLAPFLADARLVRTWAGLRPDTPDHLPVLGPSGVARLTVATGHFRNGILLAPVTARLIANLVLKGAESLQPFRADRFTRQGVVQ